MTRLTYMENVLHEALHGKPPKTTGAKTMTTDKEWSGYPDPRDPANYWIDDKTGERVNAWTGERTPTAKSKRYFAKLEEQRQ